MATIPPQGSNRLPEALERLVRLYIEWHAAEPDQGHDAKAAQWQLILDQPISAQGIEDSVQQGDK